MSSQVCPGTKTKGRRVINRDTGARKKRGRETENEFSFRRGEEKTERKDSIVP